MLQQKIFALLLFSISIDCLRNPYCNLSCKRNNEVFQHTVCERKDQECGPDVKCGPDFKSIEMNDVLRRYILNLHNKLRNKVASGNETREHQPSATNMQSLVYNMELEFIAKCWANSCNGNPLKHDKCRKTRSFDVGQNLAYFNTSSPIDFRLEDIVEIMIMYWYNEVASFKREWIRNTQDRGTNIVGHYTQLIWAETREIGCGITYYTQIDYHGGKKWHIYFFVCNYGPSGNYIGRPVYRTGSPCKICGQSKGCNKQYTSLCGENIETTKIRKNFNPAYKI